MELFDKYITAEVALYCMITLVVIENFFEIYLSWRQLQVYNKTESVPAKLKSVMTQETFHKARRYGADKARFTIFKQITIDTIVLIIVLYVGFIAYIWNRSMDLIKYCGFDHNNEVIISCVYMFLTNCAVLVMTMPFTVYDTFKLEEKHGFNKQTVRFFIIDQIKKFVVSQIIITLLVTAGVVIILRGGDLFFIWLWLFTVVVTLLMLTIYPIFIAPLFDKYTPLDEGPLKNSIEELAASLKFPLTKLYVVDGSKRSAHSNAYMYGLWNSKRIVLFDTLLLNKGKTTPEEISKLPEEEQGKGCTNEEVLAVLAHELGHWKLNHVTKNIMLFQLHLLLSFTIFRYVFEFPALYEAVGFEPGVRPVIVGLIVVLTYVMLPYNTLISFLLTMLSRRFEYAADEFAHKLGFSEKLGAALIKLHLDNLGFPVYDWLYSAWNHSHPTLLQRLDRLKELDEIKKKKNT